MTRGTATAARRGETVLALALSTQLCAWTLALAWSARVAETGLMLLSGAGLSITVVCAWLARRWCRYGRRHTHRLRRVLRGLRAHVHSHRRRSLRALRDDNSRQDTVLEGMRARLRRADSMLASLDEDLELAESVQRTLQSRASLPPHCRIETIFEPLAAISGDLYQIADVNRQCRLFLGDAMGHGVGAALITGMVQAALLENIDHPIPSQVLNRLDRLVARLDLDTYLTGALVTLNPNGLLDMAFGGGPPILHLRAQDGTVAEYRESGLPIGYAIPGTRFPVRQAEMEPGDRLLLFTDGLTEWEPEAAHELQFMGLMAMMKKHRDLALREWLDALFGHVQNLARGTPRRDDITVIALEYRPDQ